MSHELRTLHSILGFARFGLEKVANDDLSKLNSIYQIEQSGERLLSLLNNLLDLSKLDVGNFLLTRKATDEYHKTSIDDVSGTALEYYHH